MHVALLSGALTSDVVVKLVTQDDQAVGKPLNMNTQPLYIPPLVYTCPTEVSVHENVCICDYRQNETKPHPCILYCLSRSGRL